MARERWLTPDEISVILQSYERLGFPPTTRRPLRPPDGSIFIFDRAVVPDFKADGVQWMKKKDSNRTYELYVKLHVGGAHAVTGLYYVADPESPSPHYRRRCYRLVHPPEGSRGAAGGVSQVYLVHYRHCEDSKSRSVGLSQVPVPPLTGSTTVMRTQESGQETGSDMIQDGNVLEDRSASDFLGDSDIFDEMMESFDNEGFPELDCSDCFGESPLPSNMNMSSRERIKVVDMSPASGLVEGGTKILICFEGHISSSTVKLRFAPVGRKDGDGHEDDGGDGGGVSWCEGQLVCPSVIRCFSPRQPAAGVAAISIFSPQGVEYSVVGALEFDFQIHLGPTSRPATVPHARSSRKRLQDDSGADGWSHAASEESGFSDPSRRMHKIRIVEKLLVQGGDALLGLNKSSLGLGTGLERFDKGDEWLDDAQLLGMSSNDLEDLLDKFLLRVVQQLVNLASVDEDLLAASELDSLDASGFSLLHYCCLFNLSGLVSRLIDRGADLNIRTKTGSTGLHLAASSGHSAVVSQLIEAGADVYLLDGESRDAARVGEECGFSDIKLMIDKCRLEKLPTGGDSFSSNCVDKEEVPSDSHRSDAALRDPAVGSSHATSLSSPLSTQEEGSASSPSASDSISNMSLLHGALSSLSLTDKCALSLTLQGQTSSKTSSHLESSFSGESGAHGCRTPDDFEVKSVLSESDVESLDLAMSLMGPQELCAVENEVKVIQSNVRTWLLRKNYTSLRDAARTLQVAWRERRSVSAQKNLAFERSGPVKAGHEGGEGLLRSAKSVDACAATLQAATRGMLARRSFQKARKQTMASLVIFQWWVQSKSSRPDRRDEEMDVS